MRLMQTLDDAWNTQDWVTFEKRHAKDVYVFWPGQEKPTHSRPSHKEEAIAFFKIFPDTQVCQFSHITYRKGKLSHPNFFVRKTNLTVQ